jgi:hypothetical protein
MTMIIPLLLATVALTVQPPVHFEPYARSHDRYFTTAGAGVEARIESRQLRLRSAAGKPEAVVRWLGARPMTLTGEQPTGGHTNYYTSADPAGWRAAVPHYGAVRGRGLYPGIDMSFHSHGQSLEFDILAAPRADINRVRFEVSGGASITADGDLRIGADGPVFKRPEAWQIVN